MNKIANEPINKRMYFEVDKYELEMLEDTRFSRLKMYVAHEGLNNNKSNIEFSVLEDAENSIINIPILAHVVPEDSDFGEHEIEYNEDTEEVTFIEKPIGLIPAVNHNYHYEEVDGKNYAVVYGYVWNVYAQDAVAIINRDEDVKLSIEIVIDSSKFNKKTKILDIHKFRYTGITLLGKKYGTGMANAHAILENFSAHDDYTDKVKELNTYLMKFSIDDDQGENSDVHKMIKEEDAPVFKTKQEIAAFFKLTANQLYSELSRVICANKYVTKNWYGEPVERECYYLNDYDESFVYYVDVQDTYMQKKAPYTLEGDNVTINFAESKRIKYSPVDWEDGDTDEEVNAIKEFAASIDADGAAMAEKFKEETEKATVEFTQKLTEKEDAILELGRTVSETEAKFADANTLVTEKEAQITELTDALAKYKQAEDEEKVEGLFVEYASLITEDEKKELVEKRALFSTFDDYARDVKAFVCDRVIKKAKDHKMNFISMGIPNDEKPSENNKPQSLWDRLNQ